MRMVKIYRGHKSNFSRILLFVGLLVFSVFINRVRAQSCGDPRAEEAYKSGLAALKEKLYNTARQNFEKAVRYDPKCINAHFQLGLSYTYLINYQDLAIEEFKKVQELVPEMRAPTHVDAVYNEGMIYLKTGAYEQAISVLRKVLDLDPTYKDIDKIHNYLGVAFYFMDNYEMAIKEFKRAIKDNATYREANFNLKSVNMRLIHFNTGVTYSFMGNFREAIAEINKAIEIDSNFFDAHLELARIYTREGMYGDAISELIRCERINPNHRNIRKVYLNLGIAYYNQGSAKLAIDYLRRALRLESDYEEAINNLKSIYISYDPLKEEKIDPIQEKEKYIKVRMELGRDYINVGLYDKAVFVLNEVLNVDFENKQAADMIIESFNKQINAYLSRNNYSDAVKAIKKLLKITPDDINLWYELGFTYFSMPGKYWYKEAAGAFNKALSVEGSHYYLARIYREQKKYTEAQEEIRIALETNPENAEYHLLGGWIFFDMDLCEEAQVEFKLCLEQDPENEDCQKGVRDAQRRCLEKSRGTGGTSGLDEEPPPEDVDPKTLIRRGLEYYKRAEFDRALDVFTEVTEREPSSIEAHNNRGVILYRKKKLNDALVEFYVCESINPKDAETHINLAIIYFTLKDYANAKLEYEKAVAIDKERFSQGIYPKLKENGAVPPEVFEPLIILKTIK